MNRLSTLPEPLLTADQISDLRQASLKMSGSTRRAFQAEMVLKYCQGDCRYGETVFGWGRTTIETGIGEKRTGIICLGSQSNFSGKKCWEENNPEVADSLRKLAESHAQQDSSFRSEIAFTRLTAKEALKQLGAQGYAADQLPALSTMPEILNRMGYRLRKVLKAKPQKKIKETNAIFENIKEKDEQAKIDSVKRISIDCKATVKLGDFSRGGQTRGDNKALDHDMNFLGKHTPFGIVDEDTGKLNIIFGSSYKTSDFIVDSLYVWWDGLTKEEQQAMEQIQFKVDNGPESSGVRTQFLKRMVEFTDYTDKTIRLLYYPPYHSKYNPIERCWGILEMHWNGAKLTDVNTMIRWAESMTWKGIKPVVKLSKTIYKKGISLSKKVMKKIEERLERNPMLKKWDILIHPL